MACRNTSESEGSGRAGGVGREGEDPPRDDLTRWLGRWSGGDAEAGELAFAALYEELRDQARRALRGERSDHTLSATALVHEAFLRICREEGRDWEGRGQFVGVAALAMQRVLVDHARKRLALKRRGGEESGELSGLDHPAITFDADEVVAVDQALGKLETRLPERALIVRLKVFAGLTDAEIAEATGLSPATVNRRWRSARAILYRELGPGAP